MHNKCTGLYGNLAEEIIGYKTQGAIIRSKVKWYNEGERNTKYFHSLEKRHFNSKTIRNLVTDDGIRIFTDVEILQEAKNYYESLYTSITDEELSNMTTFSFQRISRQNELMIKNYLAKESCRQRNVLKA